jgi:HNH endonuclease
MAFKRTEADQLLAACHRRCCVCHRYCGVKIELHHIDPSGSGGGDNIENAIPVCFECHAEIQLYNDSHPRGRKFHPEELRVHKQQWLHVCKESPGALLTPQRPFDVGPIQALIDELDFNSEIGRRTDADTIGALFLVSQFERAIQEGVFSLLPDAVRGPIAGVYATLMRANMSLKKMATMPWGGDGSAWHHAYSSAHKAITCAQSEIPAARRVLLDHLGHSAASA